MFHGSIVALVTPFRDGKIDFEQLDQLVEFHIESGTHGIVPCGTTGESATLTHDEHEALIERVVRRVNGRIPVIAGTGSNSTDEAVRLTRYAKDVGADGALLITPYYNKPTQEGMYRHFMAIAEENDIPIVLYNVPSRTGVNLLPETVIRLGDMKNIVAIKEASGGTEQSTEILRESDLVVLSGDDSLTLPLMALGASGVISVAANIVPKEMVDLVDLIAEGDASGARDVNFRLFPLFRDLFIETNPIPIKTALALSGRIGSELRPPMCEMAPANQRRLEEVLRELGILGP